MEAIRLRVLLVALPGADLRAALLTIDREREQHVAWDSAVDVARIRDQHPAGGRWSPDVERTALRSNMIHGLVRTHRIEIPHNAAVSCGVVAYVSIDRARECDARDVADRGRLRGPAAWSVTTTGCGRGPDPAAAIEAPREHTAALLRIRIGGQAVWDRRTDDIRKRDVDIRLRSPIECHPAYQLLVNGDFYIS